MAPVPVRPAQGLPDFVSGIAMVRMQPLPVVDGAALVGAKDPPGRFVTLERDSRYMILAVQEVIEMRAMPAASLAEMPALLDPAFARRADELEFLRPLVAARLVPAEQTHAFEIEAATA